MKVLNGLDAFGFARLNGNDLASQIYVDAAVAAATGDNFTSSTETSLADYLTAIGYDGSQHAESDILYLPNAPKGSRKYWHNGGIAGDASDFINVDEVLSQVDVLAHLEGGQITLTMLSAAVTSQIGGRYSETIAGDDTTTQFTVTHGVGSSDALVQVIDVTTGQVVNPDVTHTDVNNVRIDFATAPTTGTDYRVVVRQ